MCYFTWYQRPWNTKRTQSLVIVSALISLLSIGCYAMANESKSGPAVGFVPDHPPLMPASDEQSLNDDEFAKKCQAHAAKTIESLSLELVNQLVTHSKQWGAVWRADFRFPPQTGREDSSVINRMMCWERDEKLFFWTSVAQDLTSLPSSKDKAH